MVFNTTFNNISAILSVLLMEETRVPGENRLEHGKNIVIL